MDEGKELEQAVLNILSALGTEKCKLSDSIACSSSDLGNEENKNCKVSDKPAEGMVTELELQKIPLPSFSPHLGTENLAVTKAASSSAERLGKSLNESQKVDFKMSDSHLLYRRNSREIDKGSKKRHSSPTLENVTFIDLTGDTDEEQQTELQKSSSALIRGKISGKHVAKSRHVPDSALFKSRHVPYSVLLSRHVHLRTMSCVNQNSRDHVSGHRDSHAGLIKSEKFDKTDVAENLVSASDQLSKGEGAKLDLKPSTGSLRKCNPKKLEIKTNIFSDGKGTCQSNEPMSRSFYIDLDCPDSINRSPVNETSLCFENMSLHVSDEESNLIREDVLSAGVASIKLPGECAGVNSLSNVQPQSGSATNAASSVLSKSGSATNISKNTQHTSSVGNNTVANMWQNSSAVHAHASKGIQQPKNYDMTTSTSSNIQHQTYNSADTINNMPLSISKNDSIKNIQNSSATCSVNAQPTSKSANASSELQKENCIDVIPSHAQQRINAADVSENAAQKVGIATSASAVLKKVEQKSSNATSLSSSNAQQSSNAVDASKNKVQKVGNATTAAKSMQQRNSCATNSSENVQPNGNSATLNKIQQTSSNAGYFKTTEQHIGSATSTFNVQQQIDRAASLYNVQPQRHIGSDFFKEPQQENASTIFVVQKITGPVFKPPNVLRPGAQGVNFNSCAQVPPGKIGSSQNQKSVKRTKHSQSLLSSNNIQFQPLQDCQDLLELTSCKTTDYHVQREKPKYILDESSRANTFERFKHFKFSRATDNDVLELYGRLPMSLPEDLEEVPMCQEDITDFTSKKNKVQDLEKVLLGQRY